MFPLCATSIALLSLAHAENRPHSPIRQDLEERLDALLENAAEAPDTRGVATVILLEDQVLFSGGHGRIHFGGNRNASPDSAMPAACLMDLLTSMAVLRLSETGSVALAGNVSEYLPGLAVEGEVLTVANLLTHTSGIPALPAPADGEPVRAALQGDEEGYGHLVADGLVHAPGHCQTFTDANTWALGELVERASETTLRAFVEKNFLAALDLDTAGWHAEEELDEVATWVEVAGGIERDPTGTQRFEAGRLVISAADLARLVRGIADRDVLGGVAVARMTGIHRRADATPLAYACGWTRTTVNEFDGFTAGGANGHEHLHVAWYPALGVIVALSSDSAGHDLPGLERRLVREVFDLTGPGVEDRVLPEDSRSLYVGEYMIGCDRWLVRESGERLLLDGPNRDAEPLAYQGGNEFVAAENPERRVVFRVEEDRPASSFVLIEGGAHVIAVRVR